MRFDVVIPARDEEPTVAEVVRAALAAPRAGAVLVVDDGSSDRTAEKARAGATVLSRPAGGGDKTRALALGVAAATAPVLVFFDADIRGVRPEHIAALAAPVLAGDAVLSCGIVDYGRLRNPLYLRLPPITGLRALRRDLFEAIPEGRGNGFQIEILINEVAARRRAPCAIRVLQGLSHRTKIEKTGWRQGLPAHLTMTQDLLACLRFVPLWTYGAYLRNLKVLEPVEAGHTNL